MSWRNYGELKMRQYAEVYLRASSLPHSIQDYMNTMPEFMKHTPGLQRTIFKAVIKSNTMDIEPHAPDIDIINEVDNVPCPPFEFYYTNQMWHSDNVPTPDPSKLKGCSCYPVCSPGSKTCSCLQKQRNYYTADMSGFTYDSRGRLREKYVGYPVFECNALCGCDDDCMNRVVQHGRRFKVNIEKTIDKGWGIFAAERIPARTYIGVYSGEFITDTEGEARGSVYHLGNRTYLFDVDFWHLQQGKGKNWNQNYCVDAYHAGNFTRYLNHSCDPNCQLVPVYINEPDLEKPLLAIFTIKDIFAYQELCFSYSGPPDDGKDEDGNDSDNNIFVECKCGSAKCTGKMFR
ncbi:hypothetical protein BC835DRAFT_1281601 [Cytidiella melzeri]|nr:hypothetical protein BC835DRAFT_1281601 [Cytidiella melzeri]